MFFDFRYGKTHNILITDNCICLCSNCHIFDQSTFFNENKEEIFREHAKILKKHNSNH